MKFVTFIERVLGAVNHWFLLATRWLATGLLAVMTGIVLAAVFYRYVLNDAIAWSEEVAKFLMVWMTFMAAPTAYKQGALVAVGALPEALKGRFHQLLIIVVQAVVITIMVVFIKEGSFLAWNARIQNASTVEVSIIYVYAAMPLGALGLLTVSLEMAVAAIREIIHPSPPPEAPPDDGIQPPMEVPGAL